MGTRGMRDFVVFSRKARRGVQNSARLSASDSAKPNFSKRFVCAQQRSLPMAGHHHRAGQLKQQNKLHRGTSKGALKDAAKGEPFTSSAPRCSSALEGRIQRAAPKKTTATLSTKAARRNTAKQIQQQKRNALIASTRAVDAPRVVVCLSLTGDIVAEETVAALFGEEAGTRAGRAVWPIS